MSESIYTGLSIFTVYNNMYFDDISLCVVESTNAQLKNEMPVQNAVFVRFLAYII